MCPRLFDGSKGLWRSLVGISYRTTQGELVRNPGRVPIADLDSLPWSAYDLFKMERSYSMMTSRGCPYRCAFCSQSIMAVKWRARSAENVLEEWRHLVRDRGAHEIGVLDDSANIRIQGLEELSDLLVANDLNHAPWILVNGIRADLATP